jgi:hypothetical protein
MTKELKERDSVERSRVPDLPFIKGPGKCFSLRPVSNLCITRGSTSIGYPSKKMKGTIQAESRLVEFPSVLTLERDTEREEDFLRDTATRA